MPPHGRLPSNSCIGRAPHNVPNPLAFLEWGASDTTLAFVGRLDDQGEDGMDLVRNIKKMYERGDGHVHVLVASIRTINHLLCSFFLGTELATVPSKVLQEWAAAGFPMPDHNFKYKAVDAKGKVLKSIPYKDLDLNLPWDSFDLAHELTTKGIQKFVADYRSTLKRSA